MHVHRASTSHTVRGDLEIAIRPSVLATIPGSGAMADQCQPIVARSWLLYTQIAVRGQSSEVLAYRFPKMRHGVDVDRARAVRWLSRATRHASPRLPHSVVGSALVPRQTVQPDAERGQSHRERVVQA